jgi:hypothetical protein
MGDYITKKSDKGGSKAKEEYIAKSNIPDPLLESGTAVAEKAVEKGYIDKPDKLKKKELVKKNLNKDTISNLSEFYLGKKKDYPKIGKDY